MLICGCFDLLQIHSDSSSSLGKLIRQSYHQRIDDVSLTGATPVHMLLEIGLDKMRKDFINYLIGTKSLVCDFRFNSNVKMQCVGVKLWLVCQIWPAVPFYLALEKDFSV